MLAAAALAALLAVACGDGGDGGDVTAPVQEPPPPGSPPAEQADEAERRIERAIFDLVNAERRARDLPPLRWDPQLARRARAWSREMADAGRLEHQDPETMLRNVEGFTSVGENIFHATGPLAASTIHVEWMRSEGHRANVLRDGFDRLGVGVLCLPDGSVWATERFGGVDRPAGGGQPPPLEPIVAEPGNGPSCPGGRVEGLRAAGMEIAAAGTARGQTQATTRR